MVHGTRVCPACGACLDGAAVRRKYCSDRCKEWVRLHPGLRRSSSVGRKCLYRGCRKSLDHRRIDVQYCEKLCYDRAMYGLPSIARSLLCECGITFTPRNLRQHFCSKVCSQRAAGRKWRLKNPIYVRQAQHHRRQLKVGNSGSVKVLLRDWQRLCRRYKECCAYCGVLTDNPHMDHVIPINRGGRHGIGNILPACLKCNLSKHDRLLVVWKHRQLVV